jgi:hypothetical protein
MLTITSRHAIQLYLALDGNFRLQKKKKNNDPDDVALMKGLGCFPLDSPFQDYLDRVGESKEVSRKPSVVEYAINFPMSRNARVPTSTLLTCRIKSSSRIAT